MTDSAEEMLDVIDDHAMYTGKIASRAECHAKGLRHKAVSLTIVGLDEKKVLLQRRADSRGLWPGLWDNTAGGHVNAGEWGYEAAVREAKEELNVMIDPRNMIFYGATLSEDDHASRIERHLNEYYLAFQDVDITKLKLQIEEVAEVRWFSTDELKQRISDNYRGLTRKDDYWQYLLRYLDHL